MSELENDGIMVRTMNRTIMHTIYQGAMHAMETSWMPSSMDHPLYPVAVGCRIHDVYVPNDR
jgi:hypothetical protein